MPNSVAQRIGPLTRKLLYRETTRGADPGSPTAVVLPLRDVDGVAASRPEVDASYFNGTAIGLATAPGPITAGGRTPLWLDFTTIGNILQMPIGTSAYSRVGLVTGSLHNFPLPNGVFSPASGQLQDEYLEGSPIFERLRYQLVKAIAFSYANGGAAPFDVDWVGSGDSAFTDIGGTKPTTARRIRRPSTTATRAWRSPRSRRRGTRSPASRTSASPTTPARPPNRSDSTTASPDR
jgi:hypothetical protein